MANVRSYIAGLGTTAALVLSAVLAFLAVGAVVGVNSWPETVGTTGDSVLVVESTAPRNAAQAVAGPDSAPGGDPAAAAGADGAAGGPGGPGGPGPDGGPGSGDGGFVPGGPGDPGIPVEPLPPNPPVDPTDPDPTDPTDPPSSGGDNQGVTGGLTDALDDTLEGVTGTELGLGESTQGLTDLLDQPVDNLVKGLGLKP